MALDGRADFVGCHPDGAQDPLVENPPLVVFAQFTGKGEAQIGDIAARTGPLVDAHQRRRPEVPGGLLEGLAGTGRDQRLVLGGHTDTVPANANFPSHVDNDTLWGVGAADMKGGLACMLASARRHTDPRLDLTYVFYAREEVAAVHSGLGELFVERRTLVGIEAIPTQMKLAALEAMWHTEPAPAVRRLREVQ